MVRFTNIVITYFVIGALLWGGGIIAYEQAGIATQFVESPDTDAQVNEDTASQLDQLGGPIQEAAGTFEGSGLIAILPFLFGLVNFLTWPISTTLALNAPPQVVVLVGGTPTVAFYGALLRVVRQSA